ncbi:uncharacterized protein LOC126820260 isoform X2 [Patella vulgata]|uniref:uncharacterized protein LOC126820260 isoform X2 n=1 Tax=Patella vulgata TaxID=6465 RepID=UPI0024A992D2|nr:uncharacterized protein LOC126820260 isoform X2 [Patella vulgata]
MFVPQRSDFDNEIAELKKLVADMKIISQHQYKNPEVINLHEKCRILEQNLLTKDLALKQAKKRISQLETYVRIRAYNAKVRVPESDINMRIVQKMHNDQAASHHTSSIMWQTRSMSLESAEKHSVQEVPIGTNFTATSKEKRNRTLANNPRKCTMISKQNDISEKSLFEYQSLACNPDASKELDDLTSTEIINFKPSPNSEGYSGNNRETTNTCLGSKIPSSKMNISETGNHLRVANVKGLAKLHQLIYSMDNSSTKRNTLQLDSLDRNTESNRDHSPHQSLTLLNKNKNSGDEGPVDTVIGYDEELNHFIDMFLKSNTFDFTNSISDSSGENSSGDNDL